MSEELKSLTGAVSELRKVMGNFGDIEKITEWSKDILPKEQFTATLDGNIVDVSIGFSGQCIIIKFHDKTKSESVFRELQQQKQGLFARIFRK